MKSRLIKTNILYKCQLSAGKFENLQFRQIDLPEDKLPIGDLTFIRLAIQ